MKIGELAKASGVPAKTIRFYEKQGLLPPPPRTPSRYRLYGTEALTRLAFIRRAKALGLPLTDVRGVLQLYDRREPTCVHVRALLEARLAQIEGLLRDLGQLRDELARLRDGAGEMVDCRPSGGRVCGIIEQADLATQSQVFTRTKLFPGAHPERPRHFRRERP